MLFLLFNLDVPKLTLYRLPYSTPEQYKNAKPDPISGFGAAIAAHMNDDHQDSTIAMVAHAIPGLDVSEAVITSVDTCCCVEAPNKNMAFFLINRTHVKTLRHPYLLFWLFVKGSLSFSRPF